MHDLASISVADLATSVRAVQAIGQNATSMEDCASGIVRYLYDSLRRQDRSEPANVLVRFFKTHNFGDLSPELQAAAREALGSGGESHEMKCLVLLGTAGARPEGRR